MLTLLLPLLWLAGPARADGASGGIDDPAFRIAAGRLNDDNDPFGIERRRQKYRDAARQESERRRLLEEGRRRRALEAEEAESRRSADEAERRARALEERPGQYRRTPAGSPPPALLRRTCLALYRETMIEAQRGDRAASDAARQRAGEAGCTAAEIARVLGPFDAAVAEGRQKAFDVDGYLASVFPEPGAAKPTTAPTE